LLKKTGHMPPCGGGQGLSISLVNTGETTLAPPNNPRQKKIKRGGPIYQRNHNNKGNPAKACVWCPASFRKGGGEQWDPKQLKRRNQRRPKGSRRPRVERQKKACGRAEQDFLKNQPLKRKKKLKKRCGPYFEPNGRKRGTEAQCLKKRCKKRL